MLGSSVEKDLALPFPGPSELVHLTDLTAEDEDQRGVVDPEHDDDDGCGRAGVERAWG